MSINTILLATLFDFVRFFLRCSSHPTISDITLLILIAQLLYHDLPGRLDSGRILPNNLTSEFEIPTLHQSMKRIVEDPTQRYFNNKFEVVHVSPIFK